MSSNTLTGEQNVESIKKFKFSTKGDKEELEIAIPEVNIYLYAAKQFIETNMVFISYEMRNTGSNTS